MIISEYKTEKVPAKTQLETLLGHLELLDPIKNSVLIVRILNEASLIFNPTTNMQEPSPNPMSNDTNAKISPKPQTHQTYSEPLLNQSTTFFWSENRPRTSAKGLESGSGSQGSGSRDTPAPGFIYSV